MCSASGTHPECVLPGVQATAGLEFLLYSIIFMALYCLLSGP